MLVSDVGEFGLIERIRKGTITSSAVLLGIGDDAAVLKLREGMLLVATTDLLVEGVHFLRDFTTPYALGRKAMAANLSDIAAMGGIPRYTLIALALPKGASLEFVEELYRGLREEAATFGVEIVGGDTSSSPAGVVLAISVSGEVEREGSISRTGAKAGEGIWVTGHLGASAAGLAALKAGFRVKELQGVEEEIGGPGVERLSREEQEAIRLAILAHLFPRARIPEGRAIGGKKLASAMIDISDGLASDLRQICRESRVTARVSQGRLPLHPSAALVGRLLGQDPLVYALEGGEDYELLFTSAWSPHDVEEALGGLATATWIGEVVEGEGEPLLLQPDGSSRPLGGGYNHFKR